MVINCYLGVIILWQVHEHHIAKSDFQKFADGHPRNDRWFLTLILTAHIPFLEGHLGTGVPFPFLEGHLGTGVPFPFSEGHLGTLSFFRRTPGYPFLFYTWVLFPFSQGHLGALYYFGRTPGYPFLFQKGTWKDTWVPLSFLSRNAIALLTAIVTGVDTPGMIDDSWHRYWQVTAACSRDERNAQTMKGFNEHRLLPSDSDMSVSLARGAVPSTAFKTLLSLNDKTMKAHLVDMQNVLSNPEICVPCRIHGLEHSHQIVNCTEVAIGYKQAGSKYRTWKAQVDFPTGVCYSCGYPQVSVVSESQ